VNRRLGDPKVSLDAVGEGNIFAPAGNITLIPWPSSPQPLAYQLSYPGSQLISEDVNFIAWTKIFDTVKINT
jgi:hypothetical protein